jgi:hypothetical protein
LLDAVAPYVDIFNTIKTIVVVSAVETVLFLLGFVGVWIGM